MLRKCWLRCLQDSHSPLDLPHDSEVTIGRSKFSKIRDQACSRQQVSLRADCNHCVVEIKQLGLNPSGFDGFSMIKDSVYRVGHGTRVELLLNNYFHIIEFDPPPEDNFAESQQISGKRKHENNETEERKSKSFKTDSTSIANNKAMWEEFDSRGELYVYTSKGVKPSPKIAAFDMDGTLIKTKSGKVHPVDTNDWQITFMTVKDKLKDLIRMNYKVIILSNQASIGNGKTKIEDFKTKIENVVDRLGIPIEVYISAGKGFFRKPMIGMWEILSEKKNDGIEINMSDSFYCGDAAGRKANWAPGKKKDHSMADRLFAENLQLKFYTPEEFFLGHSTKHIPINKPGFNPKDLISEDFNEDLISNEKEILVLVGFPGSGKSFLAKKIEKKSGQKYATVCRDVLGTWQRCAAEAHRLLQNGKSVIVDSTNPDTESRARWTSLAKEMDVPCRCVKMATSFAHARHNNKFRELMKQNHAPVSDIVFYSYKNKYVEPKVSEGFQDVLEVKFSPAFEDHMAEKIYRMYLLDN